MSQPKTITIPLETYECLRGHLNQAMEIFQSLGIAGGNAPAISKRETKADKLAKYDHMIITNTRGTKPEFLKRKQ